MRTAALLSCVLGLCFVSCGGNSSSPSSSPAPTALDGVYEGRLADGSAIQILVLSNTLYAQYYSGGNSPAAQVAGMISGTVSGSEASFSASFKDYPASGTPLSGTISGTLSNGVMNGTITESGTRTFSASILPIAIYNPSAAAQVANAAGFWVGSILGEESAATFAIDSAGNLTGATSSGCAFTGTLQPDASGKNFFDLSLTFGAALCAKPAVTVRGPLVVYLANIGPGLSMLAAATSSDLSSGISLAGLTTGNASSAQAP